MRALPFEPSIAGVDEAGRGPLAGPIAVAAVMLPEGFDARGIRDSKQMTEASRRALAARIRAESAWSLVLVSPREIERTDVLRATLTAMGRALRSLCPSPSAARVDGNALPIDAPCPVEAVVKGDSKDAAIAAASIIAKVARDEAMRLSAFEYPEYGFDQHFGYPTPDHLRALRAFGPCPAHRRTYGPVARMLEQGCLPLDV